MKRNMFSGAERSIFERAKALRKQQTPAEEILWSFLRQKPLSCKFRRQHPFGIYILDFYCHQLHLAIEVDGNIHLLESVKNNDQVREETLIKLGLQILRFTNEELAVNQKAVFQSITHFILQRLPNTKSTPA